MSLESWTLPWVLAALFVLGLAVMGLLFAFVRGCERV